MPCDRSLTLLAMLLCLALHAPVAGQDDCASAIAIFPGLSAASTIGLVTSTPASCGTLHRDIWLSYVAGCNGTATATLCTPGIASFDAIMAAYDGSAGCANLLPAGCSDNACGTAPSVSFSVVAGVQYYIAVGGAAAGAVGLFTLSLTCVAAIPNDDCSGALPIGNGLTTGSNIGATTSPQTSACSNMGADVWYAYTANCTGFAEATFCQPGSATFDTVLAVFDGTTPCAMLAQIACNDDTCVLRSRATFPVLAGALYYIAVGGFGGLQGAFTLSVSCHAAPSNDDCTSALPLSLGPNGPYTNQFATNGQPQASSCAPGTGDVWFSFTPACSGPYRIDTCGTGYDTILAVYAGCSAAGFALVCNDDAPGGVCGASSLLTFDAVVGATYFVRVAGANAASGSFNVNVSPHFSLSYASPLGPGSITFMLAGGPSNALYLDVITPNQGAFPNGPFFGIDPTFSEVFEQLNAGYPFLGTLDPCGSFTFPAVVVPILSGLTIYSVALAFDAMLTQPIVNTAPVSHMIP